MGVEAKDRRKRYWVAGGWQIGYTVEGDVGVDRFPFVGLAKESVVNVGGGW